MKRTLLTATAAMALAMSPAVAQVVGGNVGVETETELNTGLDTTTQSSTDLQSDIEVETPDVDTPDVETEGEVEAEQGVGGEFYENEASAATGADLESETEIETPDVETPDVDVEVGVESDGEATLEDGQGGPIALDRDDAADRYGALEGEADAAAKVVTDGADTPELNEYEKEQIEKAGPEAEAHAETMYDVEIDQ